MSFARVNLCRCCGSDLLESTVDLGLQPLANSYVPEPTELPCYPLVLNVCAACYHNQLSVVVDSQLMFQHYLYVSGTSRTLREHFAALAREALAWADRGPCRVLDLACNDGTLLEAFQRESCTVAGVDPAGNLVEMAREKGLDIVRGYWPEIAPQLRGSFDIITGCNVLAHVADPTAFLAAALERLTDRGTIVLEFPYCREMIERSEWDTIYHEHLSYFLVGPFLKLVQRLDATVSNARLVPIHGGSLRVAIRRGASEHDASILKVAQDEESDGLYQMDTYRDFSKRVDRVCRDLQDLANSPSLDGRKLVAYGASAKGNTLLNRCSLPLSYIVDDNPLKHGLFTPGANVPIKQRAALGDEPSDLCVLLLAWNFADEIVANVKRLRPDRRDLAAVYIPDVRLFPI